MTPEEKAAALHTLHRNIGRVAQSMDGTPIHGAKHISLPSPVVAEPRAELVPYLRVEMPDNFVVESELNDPLSLPYALSVKLTRTHNGGRKTDWQFVHGQDGWCGRQGLLTDDEIRACLTPEGPPPLQF